MTEAEKARLTVEPHMVERVAPSYVGACDGERRPERCWEEQKGWIAHRGKLQAWSMSRDAACTMLGFMEGREDKGESDD
jgi:hypothetical protein